MHEDCKTPQLDDSCLKRKYGSSVHSSVGDDEEDDGNGANAVVVVEAQPKPKPKEKGKAKKQGVVRTPPVAAVKNSGRNRRGKYKKTMKGRSSSADDDEQVAAVTTNGSDIDTMESMRKQIAEMLERQKSLEKKNEQLAKLNRELNVKTIASRSDNIHAAAEPTTIVPAVAPPYRPQAKQVKRSSSTAATEMLCAADEDDMHDEDDDSNDSKMKGVVDMVNDVPVVRAMKRRANSSACYYDDGDSVRKAMSREKFHHIVNSAMEYEDLVHENELLKMSLMQANKKAKMLKRQKLMDNAYFFA